MTLVRLGALVRKEFVQLWRDPVLVLIALYIFAESSLCAYALRLEVQNVPLAIYDKDRSPLSRELIGRFAASPNFSIAAMVESEQRVTEELDRGAARLTIVLPSRFEHDADAGLTPAVQIVADGTDAYSTLLADGYAQQIIGGFLTERAKMRAGFVGARAGAFPDTPLDVLIWYDPALEFAHFNIVMMLGLAVPIVSILLTAGSFSREIESGTLEHIAVSPARPWEFILAKMLPVACLTLAGLTIGIVLAVLAHAPLRGNLLFLYGATLLAFIASSGIGVLVATTSRNVQQALLLAFFVLFPLLFLSGTVTPIDSMPPALRFLTLASPLRYFGAIVINVFFKGGGPVELWPDVLALALLAAALFGAAFLRMRRGLQL